MNYINKTLNGLLIFLVIFYIWAFTFDGFNKKIVQANSYSSKSTPIKLGDISSLVDRTNPLVISTKFRILANASATSRPTPYYENIFQTSDVNNGVRLEVSYGREGVVGWGLVVGDHTGQVKGFELGVPPTVGSWHDLNIMLNQNAIKIELDNQLVFASEVMIPQYLTDDVIVGRGFSDERIFSGEIGSFEIKNESISTKILNKYHVNEVVALIIILLWIFFTPPKTANNKWLCFTAANLDSIKFIVFFLMYIAFFIYFKSSYFSLQNSAPLHDVMQLIFIIWIAALFLKFVRSPKLKILALSLFALFNYVCFFALIAGSIFLDKTATTVSGLYKNELGALYQTNFQEVLEFFWVYFNLNEKFAIFGFAALTTTVFLFAVNSKTLATKSKTSTIIALIALMAVYVTHPLAESITSHIVKGYDFYAANTNEFQKLVLQRASTGSVVANVKNTGNTYIIVIGESSNRDHYSSYGYFRDTTPFLNEQLAKQDWIFFKRAYSSFVHTTPSLLHALTEANQYNEKDYNKATSLIEVFKSAGFNTYWIDEQARALGDNPINVIASVSTSFKIVPPNNGELINQFDKVLNNIDKSKNNLIVLHLMGSHFDYKLRVPQNYEKKFNDSPEEIGDFAKDEKFVNDILDPYDTTIHYTDLTLSKLYDSAKNHSLIPDIFMYVSDHGEDVFGKKFHNAAQFTYPMARIPFILNYSDKWAKQHPEKVGLLKSRTERAFTLDLMFETLLGLADIHGYEYDKGYDFSSQSYRVDLGNAITMKAGTELDERYYAKSSAFNVADDPKIIAEENLKFLNINYPNKVLSVYNDIKSKAFESNSMGFAGQEFNITVPKNNLGHYPEISLSTTPAEYLSWMPVNPPQKLWFDVKTMKGYDIKDSLSFFEDLDKKYNFKRSSLIESWDTGLVKFSESGWYTSYYVHSSQWPECRNFTVNQTGCAKKVADKVKLAKASSISFFADDYNFVKKYLEPLLPPTTKYNTFGLPSEFDVHNKNLPNLVSNNVLFKDKRVNTILLEGTHTFGLYVPPYLPLSQ